MKRATLLLLSFLLSGYMLIAQNSSSTSNSTQASSGDQNTVQGCLSRSDNGYTLTDKAGTKYQLAGDTSKLSEHVGHEVRITGSTMQGSASASSASSSSSMSGGNSSGEPTIDVTNVEHISKTCSSSNSSSSQYPK